MSSLGHRIRILRELKHMSQTELAEQIGVKFSAISKYERGAVDNLPAYRIKRLASVLDTTPEYLLEGRAPLSNLIADDDEDRQLIAELIRKASELSDEQLRKLILMADIIKE